MKRCLHLAGRFMLWVKPSRQCVLKAPRRTRCPIGMETRLVLVVAVHALFSACRVSLTSFLDVPSHDTAAVLSMTTAR